MPRHLLPLALVGFLLVSVVSAGVLDFLVKTLGTELRETVDGVVDSSNGTNRSQCHCRGGSCICCVDFNFTFVDLGGPGCVRMTYISQEEGMAVNVSYGNSVLHSQTVKGSNPDPACLNLLTNIAQLCARFRDLAPTSEGVKGCVQFEALLLGDPHAEYHLGCFRMGPKGMEFDPPVSPVNTQSEGTTVSTEESTEPAVDSDILSANSSLALTPAEQALIDTVSDTANKGLYYISSFFGLDFGSDEESGQGSGTNSSVTTVTLQETTTTGNDVA